MTEVSTIHHTLITSLILVLITVSDPHLQKDTNGGHLASDKPEISSDDDWKVAQLLSPGQSYNPNSDTGHADMPAAQRRQGSGRTEHSEEGTQIISCLTKLLQNISASGIKAMLSVLHQCDSHPSLGGLVTLIQRLEDSSDGRHFINRILTILRELSPSQIHALLTLVPSLPDSRNTSSGSIYTWLQFLSRPTGHQLVSHVFGNRTTNIFLRIVHFLSQLPNVPKSAILGPSGSPWVPTTKVLQEFFGEKSLSNYISASSTPLMHPNIQNPVDSRNTCSCNGNHSVCLPDESGVVMCTCSPNYLRDVNGTCFRAPDKLVLTNEASFLVDPEAVPGTTVGTLSLIQHPSFVSSKLHLTVTIVPTQSSVLAVVNNDVISLILKSQLGHRVEQLAVVIHAAWQYTYTDQVISIWIIPEQFNRSTQIYQTILLDGTRNGSLLADIGCVDDTLQSHQSFTYIISKSDPLQAVDILFTFTPGGKVILTRDVNLLELSGSDVTVSLELSFQVRGQLGGSSQSVLLAEFHILVIKDSYIYRVNENLDHVVVLQNRLLPEDRSVFELRLSNLPDAFQYKQGSLQLKYGLDYETGNERYFNFALFISSRDSTQTTSIVVSVLTVDMDDEPPLFLQNTYDFTAMNGTPSGTVLGIIAVSDPDTSLGKHTYTLHGNNSQYLTIGAKGEITSSVIVEHVTFGKAINLTATAFDGNNSSVRDCMINIAIVTYRLLAKNLNKEFSATIPEHSPPGTSVTSVNMSSYTSYYFREQQTMFKLDPKTGVVTTLRELDRENTSESQTAFTIMAVETHDNCLHVIVGTLSINLADVNDNRAQFSNKLFNISVQENHVMKIPVFQTTIFDADEGKNATSHFTLTGRNTKAFTVNTTDGKTASIWMHEPLDRESMPFIELTLKALDGEMKDGLGQHGSSASVHVIVLDINDHAPIFVHHKTRFCNVTENVSSRIIGTIKATDADIGANGNVSFILENGGMGYINVDRHNGSLYTTRPLDRETISTFNLSVQAFDDGKPQRKTTTWFVVNIQDKNDNAPKFTSNHTLIGIVEENQCDGAAILTVQALDDDIDNNVTYSVSSNMFTIDRFNGEIRCTQCLDYENQTGYEVTVTARDSGKPSKMSSITARIEVQDVNDNKPVFSKPIYTANVTLLTWVANKPILILRVNDSDSGKNGSVMLNIESGNSSVYFNLTSNVLRTSSVLPPPPGIYTLNVSAADMGSPSLTASSRVVINVTSNVRTVNTRKRDSESGGTIKFPKEFHFEVFENRNYSAGSKPIGRIRASAPQGQRLAYSIVDNEPNSLFVINATTGELYHNGQVDREKTDQYLLMVRVHDRGHTSWDITIVAVTVTDVNDNPPRFLWASKNLNINVMEDIPINTEVVHLSATDPDRGDNGNVTYSISPQTDFAVGHETGIITVLSMLDADCRKGNLYHLNVTAADHGSPRLQSTVLVTINVQDVNDNPPVFTSNRYTLTVMENTKTNTMVNGIVPLEAHDKDILTATNGWIIYQRNMTSTGGRSCPFYLTQDANVNVNGELDYERNKAYSCIVTAYDMPTDLRNRRTATATVDINVMDVNDNAPVFHGTPSTFNVSRDAAVDSLVTDAVGATDRDEEAGNGDILYSLNNSYYFWISPTEGEIRVQQPLHSSPTTIQVTILATDQPKADKALTSNTTITIVVEGYPRPRFTKSRYRGTVTEEREPPRSALVVVRASDPSRLSHCCTYNIQQSEFSTSFVVNSFTGEVTQVRSVDREMTGGVIPLTVTATGDKTVGTSTAIIDITVRDINDNVPVFTPSQQIQVFNIAQEIPVGHVIGNISSYDPDDPVTSSPVYRVMKPNSRIVVDPSGSLIVAGPLVTPGVDLYTITLLVGVSDGDILADLVDVNRVVSENTTSQVILHIQQLANSHPPVFTQGLYTTNVSSIASQDETVPVPGLFATDEEGTDVTYAILAGNIRDTFLLNAATGVLSLKYDVDSSLPYIINLTVLAVDSGVVQKSSTCIVMVWVGVADTGQSYKTADYTYPIVLGVVATLLAAAVVAVIVLTIKQRTSRQLIDQLGCTNTILTAPVDDTGLRMRYARPSADRDYRDSRQYTSLMTDLRKLFYIENGTGSESGEQSRTSVDCTKWCTEPDYESIGEASAHTYMDHV